MNNSHPDPFLEIRFHELTYDPAIFGLCAGYENGEWRAEHLASHLIEWIPQFALTYSERQELNDATAVALLRKAALKIYTTDKFKRRGEIGELILHAVLCQVKETYPAVSKIYYKDSSNDTVKGFDAVHIVANGQELELWIGEVKFYTSLNQAIRDVVKELEAHTKINFLRDEFLLITDKLDPSWHFSDDFKDLIHRNKSMDDIFSRTTIPVLLCYESLTVKSFTKVCDQYISKYKDEILANYGKFCSSTLPTNICICLFLLPMHTKLKLSESFHAKLKALQTI